MGCSLVSSGSQEVLKWDLLLAKSIQGDILFEWGQINIACIFLYFYADHSHR